jgi:biotin carboxyl carrier protein
MYDLHWRNNPYRPIHQKFRAADVEIEIALLPRGSDRYSASIAGTTYEVRVWSHDSAGDLDLSLNEQRCHVTAVSQGSLTWLHLQGQTYVLNWMTPLPTGGRSAEAIGSLHAPMPGQVRAVYVQVGQPVQQGEVLLVLEAMKMEHRIRAPYDGTVAALFYQVGQSVQADAVLLELHPTDQNSS